MRQNPKHIAFIMDGNGRWAKSRGLSRSTGHKAGYDRIPVILETCIDLNMDVVSVFAWSTENWSRPKAEIDYIITAIIQRLPKFVNALHKKGICFRHIGRMDNLNQKLRRTFEDAESLTRSNTTATFNFAFNYGGRAEIINSVRRIVRDKMSIDEISEKTVSEYLWTAGLPDVDILVRTGNEKRISNFIMWQSSCATLYFLNKYWPEIAADDVKQVVKNYRPPKQPAS